MTVDDLDVLRRHDARYRAVLHASAAIVWIASPQGEFVERHPIWEEYTGQSWDEYKGGRWISAVHPDDRDRVMADWMQAVQSGASVYRTQGRIWSARHRVWRAFQTRGVPVRNADGRIVEWVGALTDVQDTVDAELRIQQRERELADSQSTAMQFRGQLRRLLDSNIIGVFSAGEDYIIESNDAFLNLIGRSRADLASGPISWRSITPPGYEDLHNRALELLRTVGEGVPFEKEYLRSDGSRVPVLVGAVALRREPLEWVCFVIDITAQKRAEAALQHARTVAEEANWEKTHFIGAVSHDLRQPLQALSGIISLLSSRPHPPPEAQLIGRADSAVRSLAGLLDATLDFSKLDAGLISPNLQDFPIERLLESVRAEFEMEAADRHLRFEVHECHSWVKSDPDLLLRIIRNFVSNATKYTSNEGSVRVECHEIDNQLKIQVRDTGVGIPPEMHKVIFEDFRQLGNPERDQTKGLGLGLSIVARTARLLGHPVVVESAPDLGSTFSVTVPIAKAAPVEATPEAPKRADGQQVLLVEDNELVSSVICELLEECGCNVRVAASAEQALQIVESAKDELNAVISDFRLPTSNGLDVVVAVRQRWPNAIAIILTGDTSDPRLQGVEAQGIKLLHKPVSYSQLTQALRR